MKLGGETKPDKRNKTTSRKFDDGVMSRNCDVITTFPIYGQFGTMRMPDSGRVVYKTYVFINSKPSISQKTENKTKKSLIQLS